MPDWIFANIGFDTNRKLWMVEFFDETGFAAGAVQVMFGGSLEITGGTGKQIEWHDGQGPFWHVRERIYREDVESIATTPGKVNPAAPWLADETQKITIMCKAFSTDGATMENFLSSWEIIRYAYDIKGNAKGFAEFFDKNDVLLGTIKDRWILVEGVARRTVGEYPNIRLEIGRASVDSVLLTRTALIIEGR